MFKKSFLIVIIIALLTSCQSITQLLEQTSLVKVERVQGIVRLQNQSTYQDVIVSAKGNSVTTDSEGKYSLQIININVFKTMSTNDFFNVTFERENFETKDFTINELQTSNIVNLDVELIQISQEQITNNVLGDDDESEQEIPMPNLEHVIFKPITFSSKISTPLTVTQAYPIVKNLASFKNLSATGNVTITFALDEYNQYNFENTITKNIHYVFECFFVHLNKRAFITLTYSDFVNNDKFEIQIPD